MNFFFYIYKYILVPKAEQANGRGEVIPSKNVFRKRVKYKLEGSAKENCALDRSVTRAPFYILNATLFPVFYSTVSYPRCVLFTPIFVVQFDPHPTQTAAPLVRVIRK